MKLPSRATLLSQNPVFWLRRNEIGSQWRAWGIVGLWAVLVGAVLLFGYDQNTPAFFGGYAVLPFGFLLKVLFALEACRFFAEGRKNGALELLLCTPLTDREIIHGQVFALWRSFLWPLAVFGVLLFVPVGLQVVSAMAHGELNAVFTTLSHSVITTVYAVRMCLDLLALCWFGMALGLTLKKPALASAWTLLIVLVLPSVLCWADILADLFLIAWGASKCQADLRRRFSEEYRETGRVPLQAGISAPPVLS